MQTRIFKDYTTLSAHAASIMLQQVREKPDAVLCLASGDSPRLACELFCKMAEEENADISQFFFVGLDEWVGVSSGTAGSCYNDFQKRLIQPLQMTASRYHLFDAMAGDLSAECNQMDNVIKEKGGIDLMIVGIGMNGHIGFNEPGVDMDVYSHVIELDETTVTVGQKYFQQAMTLEKGITLGLGHLLNSRKVLLMANGSKKAGVIRQAAEGPITNAFPASIMQRHPNGYILVDEEAGSLLKKPV